jgi:hypothetical protein
MANDPKKPGPNVYEAYGNSVAQMSFPGDLLTFSKFGEFVAGKDKVVVPFGTRVVVHVPSMLIGYVRWKDNRRVDYKMGLLEEGFVPPKRDELGYLDKSEWETYEEGGAKDPWQFSNQVVMTGVKEDAVYTFTTSSKTGRSSLGMVVKDYGHHIRQAPDEYPVVELQRSSYRDRRPGIGEVRIPFFKIVGWVPAGPHAKGLANFMGDTAEQATPETPALIEAKPAKVKPAATKPAAPKPAARTPVETTAKTRATKPTAAAKTPRRAKGPVRI